jgi:hypothetical protein
VGGLAPCSAYSAETWDRTQGFQTRDGGVGGFESPGVEKMKPPRWARDDLGHPQNTFADQNQGYTMVIRLVFGLDPKSGPDP